MPSKNKDIHQSIDNLKPKSRGGLCSISEGIATMFLKDAIKKGHGLEIPSLGIKTEGYRSKQMKFNVRIEDEKHVENHKRLTLSQALSVIADGMIWGTVTVREADNQNDTQEEIEQE